MTDNSSQEKELWIDKIQFLINEADVFMKNGKHTQAIEIIQEVLKIAPNNIKALKTYGKILLKNHKLEESLSIFTKALKLAPTNISVLRNHARLLLKLRQYDKAIDICEQALQIDPDNAYTLTTYGQALTKCENNAKAIELFERALQIKPDNTVTLNSYGQILGKIQNYEKAVEKFEQSLQIQPNNIIALNSYGKTLAEFGKNKKACEIFERALQIHPDDITALNSYGKALADAGNYEKSSEIFERALQVESNNIITLNSYGKALADAGNYEKSSEIFELSLQVEPKNIITLNNYAKVLSDAENNERACDIFEYALKSEPNNIKISNRYAKALTESGNYEKACEIFERSLQVKPDDIITIDRYSNTLNKYGKLLQHSRQFEKACEILERLLQIKPNNYISFIYARCLEELSRYTDAIFQLESIDFDSLPQYHINVIHISLGRLYYCLKLYEQGDKYFNLAIANSDDKEQSLLSSARSIFAHNPHNETAVKMLQQIGEESPRYSQALEMLTLNLSEEDYFEMVKSDYQSGLNDTEILNRAIYHKIANEISILKGIAYRILRCSQAEDPLLTGIITDIEDVLEEVNRRRALEKFQIETISDDGYEKILEIISKTAHDISDFVNNQLAIIESKTRRAMRKIAVDAPHHKQFEKLLTQLELTQVALSDLKAINEGIKIKNHHFKVKKLFETWEANPQIGHASISLDIQNGDSNFNGDEEKIKSILNELVENSLKHNAKKIDLQICMTAQDVVNPSGIRGINVPGEQKYLLIEFKDDGQGIPPDKKDWIFQPLKTTASESHGSGLGLFIIRKTLTQMNGYIQETGWKGAKFKLYIPYT
ncbi:tetratricopeptide repeat protein [Nodularia sp. UHCC 0506]|uniref:tetratricopeptide repeat-containing sensor histidine kinase n=1 Tax=Nodularia sp. UHCC 0506 TaxID=3110243 RepID=UPI002B1ED550|nr:tetratricopeptide repeat protein [Nodularia sp. UHCC 0506]MEA5517208.1 tetratricopeptide repeat protein [Nodularia sp. UHCC 0506]